MVSTDSSSEFHVLEHDGNSLGLDGEEISVFKKTNHVVLSSLLEGKDGRGLETEVILEVHSDFSNESLEGKFSVEELSRRLETTDVSEGNGTWSESMGFLDTNTSVGGSLTLGRLGSNSLSGLFSFAGFS